MDGFATAEGLDDFKDASKTRLGLLWRDHFGGQFATARTQLAPVTPRHQFQVATRCVAFTSDTEDSESVAGSVTSTSKMTVAPIMK